MDRRMYAARMRELDALLNQREGCEHRLVAVKSELRRLTRRIDQLTQLLDCIFRSKLTADSDRS